MTMFVVVHEHGAAWDAVRPMREQDAWIDHAAFMDALADDGFIVLGGPLGDGSTAMLVIDAADEDTVRARLAPDPWAVKGLLTIGSLQPWTILLKHVGSAS
jgi:uncharacterized protein YciI